MAEKEVNKIFERIMELADHQKPMNVTDEEVEKVITTLKKKKAADKRRMAKRRCVGRRR